MKKILKCLTCLSFALMLNCGNSSVICDKEDDDPDSQSGYNNMSRDDINICDREYERNEVILCFDEALDDLERREYFYDEYLHDVAINLLKEDYDNKLTYCENCNDFSKEVFKHLRKNIKLKDACDVVKGYYIDKAFENIVVNSALDLIDVCTNSQDVFLSIYVKIFLDVIIDDEDAFLDLRDFLLTKNRELFLYDRDNSFYNSKMNILSNYLMEYCKIVLTGVMVDNILSCVESLQYCSDYSVNNLKRLYKIKKSSMVNMDNIDWFLSSPYFNMYDDVYGKIIKDYDTTKDSNFLLNLGDGRMGRKLIKSIKHMYESSTVLRRALIVYKK